MKRHEFTFDSVNSESYVKPITVLVIEPDTLTPDTPGNVFNIEWSKPTGSVELFS